MNFQITYISLHLFQTTGTTIAASAKIQINMAVRQMSQFDSLKDVRTDFNHSVQ